MTERRSKQSTRFAAAMITAGLLFLVSIAVYNMGGRTETARQIGAGIKWACYSLAVVALLLRWKGPWREQKS